MIEKIPTLAMSREDWLRERRGSIGGSDAGAILGLNPYRSPYAVWAEKTGRVPEQEDNEAMRQGRDLEAYVAQRFSETSGRRVERCNYILRNSDAPYLHANIDRRIIGEKSGLECKTASALNLKAYRGGQFPESYYVQCVSYLTVTGWERWYLAALVLGKAFRIYQITTVENDAVPDWCESSVYVPPDEIAALKGCVIDFWENCVLTGSPPSVDGTGSTSEALRGVYAEEDGSELELFGREPELDRYFRLSEEKKDLEREMERIKQELMQDMGASVRAFCGKYRAIWSKQVRRTFDATAFRRKHPGLDISDSYKTSETRVFRLKEMKEE